MYENKVRNGLALIVSLCLAGIIVGKAQEAADRPGRVEGWAVMTPATIEGQETPTQSLAALMNSRKIPGVSVAIVDRGEVAWAKAYGVTDIRTQSPVTTVTRFNAGSIAKTVTALTVLRLADKGLLDLDRDVSRSLVGWRLPFDITQPTPVVTLRQLLSHTSGTGGHFPAKYSPVDPVPTLLDILRGTSPAKSPKVMFTRGTGQAFEYSSAAFTIVQQVLEDVSKEPFADLVKREVFVPARMTNSTFTQPNTDLSDPARATGHVNGRPEVAAVHELAAAGLWTTPSDLARLLAVLQKSGEPGGLLSARSYRQMLTPVINNVGLGVFLAGAGDGARFRVRGTDGQPSDGFNAFMVGYARGGNGAVIMCNGTNLFVAYALMRSIAREYGWNQYLPMKTVATIAPEALRPYLGTFQIGTSDEMFTFVSDAKGLYVELGGNRIPLVPLASNKFFMNVDMLSELEIIFPANGSGPIDEIILQYPTYSHRASRRK